MKALLNSVKNGWGRRSVAFALSLVMALSMAFGSFALADEEQPTDISATVQEAVGSGADFAGMILGSVVEALKEVFTEIGALDLEGLEIPDLTSGMTVSLPPVSGAVRAELADAGAELVAALLGMDVSWFKNVELDWAVKNTTLNAVLNLNENALVSAFLTYDAESQTLYAQLPELSKSFIKMNIGQYIEQATEQMAGSVDQLKEMLPMLQQAVAMLPEYMPDGEVVSSIVSRYGNIIASHLKDIKSEKGILDAELIEMKEEAVIYTATITEEELANTFYEILVTAKDDEELKGIVVNAVNYVNALNEAFPDMYLGETDAEETWEDLADQIDYLSQSVANSTTEGGNAKAGNFIQLKIYVDGNGAPIGCAFILANDGEEPMELVHIYAPSLLGANGIELVVSQDGMALVSFAGTGGITATGYNGSYKLAFYGMEMAEFDLVDVGQTKDGLEGSLIVKPGYGLGAVLGDSAAMLLTYSLKFNWQLFSDVAMLHISLLNADSAELVKLSLGIAPDAEVTEAMPGEEDTVYDIENYEDGSAYGAEIDIQGLLEKLIGAGVPEGLINSLLG